MSQFKNLFLRLFNAGEDFPGPHQSQAEIQARGYTVAAAVRAFEMYRPVKALGAFLGWFLKHEEVEALIENLPTPMQNDILRSCQEAVRIVEDCFEVLRNVSDQRSLPERVREFDFSAAAVGIEHCHDKLIRLLGPLKNTIDTELALEAVASTLDKEKRAQAEADYKRMTQALANLESSLESRFQALATLELKEGFTDEIDAQITAHNGRSKLWGGFLGGALFVAARLLIWMSVEGDKLFFWDGPVFRSPPPGADLAMVVSFTFSKILLATFAFGVCMIAARMYQTHVHNSVANSHRKIAMACFSKLYQSLPQSDAVSNSRHNLVVQAGEAIFSPGSTGFLPKGTGEFSSMQGLVAEVLKAGKSGE